MAPASAPKAKLPLRAAKPANWLADALEKETKPRDDDNRLAFGETGELSRPVSATQARSELRGIRSPSEPIAWFDPLARFLGDWMTPQDYALLKPAHRRSEPAGVEVPAGLAVASERVATQPELPFGLRGGEGSIARGAVPKPDGAAFRRDNPYLQTLANQAPANGIIAAPQKLSPTPPASNAPAAKGTMEIVPGIPAQKSPDFSKPTEDEKYFKQLKRF